MTKLALALSAALALVSVSGCKSKGSTDGKGGADVVAKMTELKTKMCACTDSTCATKVSDELTRWMQDSSTKKKPLDAEQQKRADALGSEMGDCLARASSTGTGSAAPAAGSGSAVDTGSGSAAGSGSAVASGSAAAASGLPKECDDYKAAVDRLATCEAMAKGARETLVKAYQDAAEGWKKLPDAAKDKIRVSCKAGAEAVISAAKTQCGW